MEGGGPSFLDWPVSTQTHSLCFGLAYSNTYPIYDLLEWGLMLILWNDNHRISMILGYSWMSKRCFCEGPVMMVHQRSWNKPVTHCNIHLVVGANWEKEYTVWYIESPNITRMIRKPEERGVFFSVCFVSFLTDFFGGILFGRCCRGEMRICRDGEVSRIWVQDMKFPKIQLKIWYKNIKKMENCPIQYVDTNQGKFHRIWPLSNEL